MNLKEDLLSGEKKIGVWGCGFIGLSLGMCLAHEGVKSLLYDVDKEKIKNIKQGICDVTSLESWSGFNLKRFVDSGLIDCTDDWNDMRDPNIVSHHVCIPTERDACAWYAPLDDVLLKLVEINPKLVVIESTLGLDWTGRITVNINHLHWGISPRIDWFVNQSYTLKALARPYCGNNDKTSELMYDDLSIVCDNLVKTSDVNVASFVKALQNSLLHVPAVYACQLAVAFPDMDILECLKLAATHPRINHYFPNIQIGGYCIPMGSQYIHDANKDEDLNMLNAVALEANTENPYAIADKLHLEKYDAVGFLGISYKGDLKVSTLTATKPISEYVKGYSKKFYVHDPYYSEDEIAQKYRTERIAFPTDLSLLDFIIIVTDHREYIECPVETLLKHIKKGTMILDVFGVWERYGGFFDANGIVYTRLGRRGWISKLKAQ